MLRVWIDGHWIALHKNVFHECHEISWHESVKCVDKHVVKCQLERCGIDSACCSRARSMCSAPTWNTSTQSPHRAMPAAPFGQTGAGTGRHIECACAQLAWLTFENGTMEASQMNQAVAKPPAGASNVCSPCGTTENAFSLRRGCESGLATDTVSSRSEIDNLLTSLKKNPDGCICFRCHVCEVWQEHPLRRCRLCARSTCADHALGTQRIICVCCAVNGTKEDGAEEQAVAGDQDRYVANGYDAENASGQTVESWSSMRSSCLLQTLNVMD